MKKIIVILILLFSSLPSFAQMVPQWKNVTGEIANTRLWTKSMAQDSWGNSYVMIVAQYLPTALSTSLQPYIIKINTEGETVWKKDFGFYTDRSEFPYDIKIDNYDNIYFYCYQLDTASHKLGANLIKMNIDGDELWKINLSPWVLWDREFVNLQLDNSGSVFATSGDKIYKISPAGLKLDSVSSYSETFVQIQGNKIVTYYDSTLSLMQTNGTALWRKTLSHYGTLSSIISDNNSCVYLAFIRSETLIGNILSVYKYDLNGNMLWNKEMLASTNSYNKFYSLAPHLLISGDNNLIVGTNTILAPFSYTQISFVAKFNSQTGDSMWTVRNSRQGDMYELVDMIQDRNSNIYIAGLGASSQNNKYSIEKISPNGEILRRTTNLGYLSDSLQFTPIKMSLNQNNDLTVSGFNDYYSNDKVYAITIKYSQPVNITPSGNILPDKFSLKQNYPNPFNPSTTISFQIPKNNFVSLKVYDINGREVSELVNENLNAGEYKINFDGASLPSGIYYYKLTGENFSEVKKMVLVK